MDRQVDLGDVARILTTLLPPAARRDLADRLVAAEARPELTDRQCDVAEALAVLIGPSPE